MKIRRMVLEDYDGVVALWRAAALTYRPAGRDSVEAFEKQLEQFGDIMLVAEEDGRIVGTAIGSHDVRKGWVNRVAVLPERRRTGIAKKLLEHLEQKFEKLGINVFCVLIEDKNDASKGLFEEMGYSSLDTVKYYSKRPGWDV